MKSLIFLCLIAIYTLSINGFLYDKKKQKSNTGDYRIFTSARIYSNLAEIIQPLGTLPLEFSDEDWSDIRPDSITLVGANVNVTQQTITKQKKTISNSPVFVRTPSSLKTGAKYAKAIVVDDKRFIVKMIDKEISSEPIYFKADRDDIVYNSEPPQTKYYVNFTYDTNDAVYLSYLRLNMNWKTCYRLNLFEETKPVELIAMADIHNDGQSKVDIEYAELLGGDINLGMSSSETPFSSKYMAPSSANLQSFTESVVMSIPIAQPTVGQGEELAGLYVFTISQPFTIEANTNYLLPMFRPKITIERYYSISKYFSAAASKGKAQRSYRLSSDRFLSQGNCIIREFDRFVGETYLPDLAAKNKHEFSIGKDADIVYMENTTLIFSNPSYISSTLRIMQSLQQKSVYAMNLTLKNYKKNRAATIEFEEKFTDYSVKLLESNTLLTQDGSSVKALFKLAAGEEKYVTFRVELIR